ncbi:MAG: DUF3276 family protein [Treponema sp.]|nr:DUF3276 family protein [Treponema sp.]
MGARGELFTTQITLDNRSYFFNIKENRTGDVFLQIVESKSKDGGDFDRHQIAIFADDMQKFLQGMEKSLTFIEKDRKNRQKIAREKKEAKEKAAAKKIYRVKGEEGAAPAAEGPKKTGRIHVVSKRQVAAAEAETKSEE